MRRLALAAALLLAPLVAPRPVTAQPLAIPGSPRQPGVPDATYAPGFFSGPVRAYAVRGCADGPALDPTNAPITLTVFCAAGRLTIGHAPTFGAPDDLVAWYDVALATHPLVTRDLGDISIVYASVGGLLTGGEDCPGTCSDVFFPSFPATRRGRVFTFDPSLIDETPGARFVPTLATIGITYPVGTGTAAGTEYAPLVDAAFVPIPEPATWALFGAGLAALGLGARRRRMLPPA